jgi:vacuolar-type H+-ATPase subunit E/Vma4
MTEHRLLAAMEEEVAAKIAEIQRQADEAIRAINTAADQTLAAEQAVEETRLGERLRQYEQGRRTTRENEWRSRIRQLQFEVVEQVFGELSQAAGEVSRRGDYPAVWSQWFGEAWTAYRAERADAPILRTSPADRQLAEGHAAEVAGVEVRDAIADGLELLSPDRRLRIVNTMASRLQRGRDEFLKMISDAFQEQVKA